MFTKTAPLHLFFSVLFLTIKKSPYPHANFSRTGNSVTQNMWTVIYSRMSNQDKLSVLLDCLDGSPVMIGMHFEPAESKNTCRRTAVAQR